MLAETDETVLSDEKRTELRVFRKKNGINSSAHMCALKKLGWTVDEYEVRSNFQFFIPCNLFGTVLNIQQTAALFGRHFIFLLFVHFL